MGRHVTLDLAPEVAERAQAVAAQSQRRVEDVLREWLGRAATDVAVDLPQPLRSGPARSMVIRTSTRCSFSMACRYSSQLGCSPTTRR
jgi:hypothetical protein